MKQFFQLLFICFGLLILLGLNEKESGETNLDLLDPSTQSFREFCVCTPVSVTPESESLLTASVTRQLPEYFRQQTTQKEQAIATRIHTRILLTRDRYMDFYPNIREKTGQCLQLAARRGDLTPA